MAIECIPSIPGELEEVNLRERRELQVDARDKMFLSQQAYEGLKISVHSHVEAIKFLLENGFEYVLSERFMQDFLEDYFGHHRRPKDTDLIIQLPMSLVIMILP